MLTIFLLSISIMFNVVFCSVIYFQKKKIRSLIVKPVESISRLSIEELKKIELDKEKEKEKKDVIDRINFIIDLSSKGGINNNWYNKIKHHIVNDEISQKTFSLIVDHCKGQSLFIKSAPKNSNGMITYSSDCEKFNNVKNKFSELLQGEVDRYRLYEKKEDKKEEDIMKKIDDYLKE